MYFNICASKKKQLQCACNYFSFSRTRRRATKSLNFFPCGALAKKKKHKIYVFQCAKKTITVRIHRMEKVSKNKLVGPPWSTCDFSPERQNKCCTIVPTTFIQFSKTRISEILFCFPIYRYLIFKFWAVLFSFFAKNSRRLPRHKMVINKETTNDKNKHQKFNWDE